MAAISTKDMSLARESNPTYVNDPPPAYATVLNHPIAPSAPLSSEAVAPAEMPPKYSDLF